MIIRNNTIIFKSGDKFFKLEREGKKCNTVRFFNDPEEMQEMDRFCEESNTEQKFIEIQCTDEPLMSFKRTITNLSNFEALPGHLCWIISWEPPRVVPCMDIETCNANNNIIGGK